MTEKKTTKENRQQAAFNARKIRAARLKVKKEREKKQPSDQKKQPLTPKKQLLPPKKQPSETVEPYNRLPGETDKAYHAFEVYRDAGGKRGITATADAIGSHKGLVSKWSKKYNWRERVRAWDNRVITAKMEGILAEVKTMQSRQTALATGLQTVAAQEIDKLIKLSKESPDMIITPEAIVKLVKTGADLERLVAGVPNQIIEERVTGDTEALAKLSLADLKELKRIRAIIDSEEPKP